MYGDCAMVSGVRSTLLIYILHGCSCCVDEIAAEHAKCDSIIHFGSSCLSPSSRLPVALVFPVAEDFDAEDCCTQIRRLMETQKEAIILYDTEYFPVLGRFTVFCRSESVRWEADVVNEIPRGFEE